MILEILTFMTTNILLLLLFTLAITTLYYAIPSRKRWFVLVLFNFIFYIGIGILPTLLLFSSSYISYLCGIFLERYRQHTTRARCFLFTGITYAILLLVFFKYFNFFAGELLPVTLTIPLGISYYLFKTISYITDVYKGQEAERHFGYYCLYISFYPQIMSGPIQRSNEFLPQLKNGLRWQSPLIVQGLQLILLGLFKKIVIANRIAIYTDTIWTQPNSYPALALLLSAVLFSFQIYCDFSGYSDLAIGMGNLFGIKCSPNFLFPYFSQNSNEFWNRWHISLSSWLKDYVYIPLGGSRKNSLLTKRNLLLTFLISGIWHGTGWTFLIWGLLHGIWVMCSTNRTRTGIHGICSTILTFIFVSFTWIFFSAPNLSSAITYFTHMITNLSFSLTELQNTILPFTNDNTCVSYALCVFLFIFLLLLYEYTQYHKSKVHGTKSLPQLHYIWCSTFFILIVLFGVFGESNFIYAQF